MRLATRMRLLHVTVALAQDTFNNVRVLKTKIKII
jgi:hypothetical protein